MAQQNMILYDREPYGWTITNDCFDSRYLAKFESIFAQSNGYLGIRAALEESYAGETRGAFVTGTFNCAFTDEVTELPNLPDVTRIEIYVNGYRFHLDSGTYCEYQHQLNLKTGEVTRKVTWTAPDGTILHLHFGRVVSLVNEHLYASYVEITPENADVELKIVSGIDGRMTNTGSQHFTEGDRRLLEGGVLRVVTETNQSKVMAAVHCVHRIEGIEMKQVPAADRRTFFMHCTGRLKAGETAHFEKIASYHTGRDLASDNTCEDLCARGKSVIYSAAARGYASIAAETEAAWNQFWDRQDIQIQCNDLYDQVALRHALYELNGMVKRDDNRVGIGAKALTGEGYKGHSFWDTEMFILPFYQFTDPSTARTLLEYRWKMLPGARKKAAENHYEGAMFPWESAWLDDGEVTPLWGGTDITTGKCMPILTGMIEQHITSDIAWSVWQYYMATGDESFMAEYGCELLLDTAIYWMSRADYNKDLDRYELLDVIGPDEYKDHVDNNAYTNYMALENLRNARRILDIMPEKWPDTHKKLQKTLPLEGMAEKLEHFMERWYLPSANEEGIIPQNDQYLNLPRIDLTKYRQQHGISTIGEELGIEKMNASMVSKQADTVMLLSLMGERFSQEVCHKNFQFYEQTTVHDSSLSYSTHCLVASRLGDRKLAYKMFRNACEIDIGPAMNSSNAGIHSAAMGGLWQSAVFGFAGLNQVEARLAIDPHLPDQWSKMSFHFIWQGCSIFMNVTHEMLELTNEGSCPVTLIVGGEVVDIAPKKIFRNVRERKSSEI